MKFSVPALHMSEEEMRVDLTLCWLFGRKMLNILGKAGIAPLDDGPPRSIDMGSIWWCETSSPVPNAPHALPLRDPLKQTTFPTPTRSGVTACDSVGWGSDPGLGAAIAGMSISSG